MTPEQIAAGASCFQCLNEDQKRAAILYLLDQFASGGSGGGGLFVLKAGDTMTGRLVSPNINYTAQGSTPTAPASGFVEFADSTGRKSWIRGSDGFVRTWDSTLTGNRVFSLPDATTTIAGLNVAQTFTLANTFSANGALSAPAVSFTGTPITGGSASTTQGLVKIGSGTSGGLSTSGTMLEIQSSNAFAGDLANFGANGTTKFSVTFGGTVTAAGSYVSSAGLLVATTLRSSSDTATLSFGSSTDTILSRKAASNWQLGAADAAAPVAQTLSVQSVVAGTSNTAGSLFTQKLSAGTGTGAGGGWSLQYAPAGSSGSSQNSFVNALRVVSGGTSSFVQIGAASTAPYLFAFTGTTASSATVAGQGLSFYGNQTSETDDYAFCFTGGGRTATSGTAREVAVVRSFVPTSGTAAWNVLSVIPTINQTGGANGITRGLYINPTLTAAADFRALEISDGNVVLPKTVTAGGTTGAQTINKVTGSVNFAAAATSLVVTNSYVTTSSIIIATVATNDTTMKSVAVVAAAGSFTIYANAAATAETRVNFIVTN